MSEVYGSILSSNGSQYLHPDYLQPLPTTLDAKKSPLALLAQTCSSIGKDSNVPPSKSIIPPIEKKKDSKSSTSKSETETKCSYPTQNADILTDSSEKQEQPIGSSLPSRETCKSPGSCTSESIEDKHRSRSVSPAQSHGSSPSREDSDNGGSSHTNSDHTNTAQKTQDSNTKRQAKSPTMTSSTSSSTSTSSKPGSAGHPLQPSLNLGPTLPPGYPLFGAHGLPIDPALASAYSSLGAHGLAGLTSPLSASALKSPYVSYSRIRTSTGSTLIPVCRDPYCTNCQLSLQNSHLSATCTAAGCSQCAHEKSLLASMYAQSPLPPSLPPSLSSLGQYGSMLGASFYPYGLLTAGSHGLPFVCNWVSGSDYCGKRFNTSEELLHHLRTHTSSTDSSHYPLGLLPPSASSLAALHAHYMAPPGSLSPNSAARRSQYPLSLSPVSTSLASSFTSSRFHPYKPSLPPLPPAPPLGPPHPTLAPYYSPYSLYAQRIGAAAP